MQITSSFTRVLVLLSIFNLAACSDSDNSERTIRSDDQAYAYRANTPYADVLKDCVMVQTIVESCSLLQLPFIGQQQVTPDKDAIMQRVLVTHDWMGLRFSELLDILPGDIKLLLGSVTSIYIGSKVRPSFYSSLNGTIHLDPDFLWLTNVEKQSVATIEDYRTNYGADLQFDFFRRYVLNQDYAWDNFSLFDTQERTLEEIKLPVARLLYHELAHANDFMPKTEIGNLDTALKIYDAVDSVRDTWRWSMLEADYPLTSSELKSLAKVRFNNATPTEQEKTIDGEYVGALMENDGAVYFYGYYTQREDLAGLFEATMMKMNFDVDMDVAFVTKPADPAAYCNQYSVEWGVRNRLGNTLVAPRARFVTELVLGANESIRSLFEQSLTLPQSMRIGEDWCANLVLEESPGTESGWNESPQKSFRKLDSDQAFIE